MPSRHVPNATPGELKVEKACGDTGIPPAKARRIGDNEIKPSFAAVLAWGVLAVVLLFFAVALFSTNTLAFGTGTTMSTQP